MQVNAPGIAVTAVATAAGLTAAANIATGKPVRPRLIIGAGVAAVMLSAAAGIAPQLVRALSVVVIIGALLGPGYALTKPLTSLVTTD